MPENVVLFHMDPVAGAGARGVRRSVGHPLQPLKVGRIEGLRHLREVGGVSASHQVRELAG